VGKLGSIQSGDPISTAAYFTTIGPPTFFTKRDFSVTCKGVGMSPQWKVENYKESVLGVTKKKQIIPGSNSVSAK